MWDAPSNGLIIQPDPIREKISLFLKEIDISILLKEVQAYDEWYVSGDTSMLAKSLCNDLWKKFGTKKRSELADFKDRLHMYDAICREIANRVATNDRVDRSE